MAKTDQPPLTVSVSLGATVPAGDYGNVKPNIRIDNIVVGQPIEPQVSAALEAARIAFLEINTELESRLSEILEDAADRQTLRERIERTVAWITDRGDPSLENIAQEISRLNARVRELNEEHDKSGS